VPSTLEELGYVSARTRLSASTKVSSSVAATGIDEHEQLDQNAPGRASLATLAIGALCVLDGTDMCTCARSVRTLIRSGGHVGARFSGQLRHRTRAAGRPERWLETLFQDGKSSKR